MTVLSYVPIPQLSAHEFVPEGYHVGQPIMKKKAGQTMHLTYLSNPPSSLGAFLFDIIQA